MQTKHQTFKGVDLYPLRVDAAHDVLDRAVFTGGVHGLEDEQETMAILGIHLLLEFVDFFLVFANQGIVVFVVVIDVFHLGLCLGEFEWAAIWDAERFDIEL